MNESEHVPAEAAEQTIAALVARYALPHDARGQLVALLDLVAADPLAPTALREPGEIAQDHFADSLVALELAALHEAKAIADIGAGAGFPGLPLAVALPGAEVGLIESSSRKCAFLERAVAICRIGNARVLHARVEEVHQTRFDVVTARALAPLAVVAEYAAPLLRIGGTFVAWRGRREPDAERVAKKAADELGLEVLEPVHARPYSTAENRYLHLMTKIEETPARFPRRPGVARKRPLGER